MGDDVKAVVAEPSVTLTMDQLQGLVSKAVAQAIRATAVAVQSPESKKYCRTCGDEYPPPPDSGMNPLCPECDLKPKHVRDAEAKTAKSLAATDKQRALAAATDAVVQ